MTSSNSSSSMTVQSSSILKLLASKSFLTLAFDCVLLLPMEQLCSRLARPSCSFCQDHAVCATTPLVLIQYESVITLQACNARRSLASLPRSVLCQQTCSPWSCSCLFCQAIVQLPWQSYLSISFSVSCGVAQCQGLFAFSRDCA